MSGPGPFLRLCGGLILWASAFVWLYAVLSIGCAGSWQRALPAVLASVWLLHLAAGVLLQIGSWRFLKTLADDAPRPQHFVAHASVWLMAAGWVGILFVGWPLLLLEPCR